MRLRDSSRLSVQVNGEDRPIVRGRVGINGTDHEVILPNTASDNPHSGGYDTTEAPVSEFTHLWALDEASAPFVDQIGSADLTLGSETVTTQQQGVFGNDATVEVDETGFIEHQTGNIAVDLSQSFSMGVWLNHQASADFQAAFMLCDPANNEALGIGTNGGRDGFGDHPNPKILSYDRTPGTGPTLYEYGTWHMYTMRYDADTNTAQLFFDDEAEYSIEPQSGPDWIPGLDTILMGFRTFGNEYRYPGFISWPWMMQGYITDSEIQTLYEAV